MRRFHRRSTLTAIAIAALAASLYAGQVRDATGTAVISGVVVTDSSSPEPLRRAAVRLAGAAGTSTRLIGTDDNGRFAFTALPAGSYTLSAARAGYVTTFHGSSRPGRGPGVPVAVADGARVDVTMRILRGAVITGTMSDVRGNPMPDIAIHAVELGPGGAATPARAMTDHLGVYRIFGLPPGDYLVAAIPRLGPVGGSMAITGDVVSVTDAEAQWARAGGGAGSVATRPAAGRPVAYAPVFYPGTADAAGAAIVKVNPGEERAGANMIVRIVPVATIAGAIIDADGQPVTAATISLFPRRRDRPAPSDLLVSSGALVLPRGTATAAGFSVVGVSPGDYTLVARSGSGQRGAAAAPPSAAGPLWSVMDLTMDGNDRRDVMLRLLPGLRITGSVAFERSTLPPPQDLSALEVTLVAAGSYLGPASTPRAVVDTSTALRFNSIPPGTYLLRATPPRSAPGGASWTLKSAMLGNRDLADVAIEVAPGGADLDELVVTFTDRASEISGRLVDSTDRPVTRYSIVVFTTERGLWRPNARRVRSARPATDGSFTVSGLPAGSYAIAGVEDLDSADLSDPEFLSQLLAWAFKLTLVDGERKRQDLRVR